MKNMVNHENETRTCPDYVILRGPKLPCSWELEKAQKESDAAMRDGKEVQEKMEAEAVSSDGEIIPLRGDDDPQFGSRMDA